MQPNTCAPLEPGHQLVVDGVALNYTAAFSDSRFPTLVLIHGYGSSLQTWHDLYPLLAKRYSVVSLDLKGSGFSSKPQDRAYAPNDQAVLVMEFIRKLGLTRVVLVGHSLGGEIAMLTYLDMDSKGRSSAVRGLVLIDSAGCSQKMPLYVSGVRNPLTRFLANLLPPEKRARYVLERIFWDKGKVTPERVHRHAFFLDLPGSHEALTETARWLVPEQFRTFKGHVREIDLPTLIIWGRDDPVLPVKNARQFHMSIRNSQLEVLSETGHVPHEEKPETVFQLIHAFVAVLR